MSKRMIGILALALLGLVILVSTVFGPDQETSTVERASAQDIKKILSDELQQVFSQIPPDTVELSMPIDGQGPRIAVRVELGSGKDIPKFIFIELDGRTLQVPLDASETFEPYSTETD